MSASCVLQTHCCWLQICTPWFLRLFLFYVFLFFLSFCFFSPSSCAAQIQYKLLIMVPWWCSLEIVTYLKIEIGRITLVLSISLLSRSVCVSYLWVNVFTTIVHIKLILIICVHNNPSCIMIIWDLQLKLKCHVVLNPWSLNTKPCVQLWMWKYSYDAAEPLGMMFVWYR